MSQSVNAPKLHKKVPAWLALDEEVARLAETCKLDNIHSFAMSAPILREFVPALMTNRPELIAAVAPRALDADEAGMVFKMMEMLVATILAHQEHARGVARLAETWDQQFTGLRSVAGRIIQYASFERLTSNTDDDA